MLDINEIKKYIPHRYPFLLVDRIIETDRQKKIVGLKNVTGNEEFFNGHFPDFPIMPGVLILEAMAQVACVLSMIILGGGANSVVYFMGIDKAKFRKPVVPGDQLRMELEVLKQRGKIFCFQGNAYVGENLVAEAELKAMLGNEK
ncbi:MAG: 3-hydroxyacyl-ACP dehydratase FabZ [Nitrospinae bacterium]|nr:3-hydroxyacyl-ACP dehydratase FabZ [Nitrospinota bacterium]